MGANKLFWMPVRRSTVSGGGSALTGAVENEDSDLMLFELFLRNSRVNGVSSIVNYKRRSITLKWKAFALLPNQCTGYFRIDVLLWNYIIESCCDERRQSKAKNENGADPYIED